MAENYPLDEKTHSDLVQEMSNMHVAIIAAQATIEKYLLLLDAARKAKDQAEANARKLQSRLLAHASATVAAQ